MYHEWMFYKIRQKGTLVTLETLGDLPHFLKRPRVRRVSRDLIIREIAAAGD